MPSVTITKLDSVVAMASLGSLPDDGDMFQCAGYYEPGDGGGGLYRFVENDETQPNYGSVVGKYELGPEEEGYLPGRFFIVHQGFLNVRQFGAIGDGSVLTLQDQSIPRWDSDGHVLRTYGDQTDGSLAVGRAFSGLILDGDTVDWAAVQVAIDWCSENGVRLEVPSGVYMCRRPLWLGNDDPGFGIEDEPGGKGLAQMAFTFVGQNSNSRQQADSVQVGEPLGSAANIRLTEDMTNRFVLSMTATPPSSGHYVLRIRVGDLDEFTDPLDDTDDASAVIGAIQNVLDLSADDYTAALDGTDGGTMPLDENIYFTVKRDSPTPEFVGEILAFTSTDHDEPTNWVRCFPDCGIVSFRRSAGARMRVENLTLKGNGSGDVNRFASFGILFATSQFVGHVLERMYVNFADTVVGLLQGTGSNGEWTRFGRFAASECRRGYYSNATQAFEQEMDGWNMALDVDGVYCEFDDNNAPGVGVHFQNAHGTFGGGAQADGAGTLVRVRRGTGVLKFESGRIEHLACLFDYESVDGKGSENNMDVLIDGMEFDGVRGGTDRTFVNGAASEFTGSGTQYGLYVTACRFVTYFGNADDKADLYFTSLQQDNLRCIFEKCRFSGVKSLTTENVRPDFVRCFKSDFIGSGHTESPLRQFEQSTGAPVVRTQSLRSAWQDTPWVQTGPRTNILGFSDFRLQELSTGPLDFVAFNGGGSWVYEDPYESGIVFGKWGSFDEANISPSPEAFYVGLDAGAHLENILTAIRLDLPKTSMGSDDASKVVTYQCLCQVKGRMRFKLVTARYVEGIIVDPDDVLDEVVVESPTGDSGFAFTDTMLVNLRGQVSAHGSDPKYAVVWIENMIPTEIVSAARVYWQQAWGGTEAEDQAADYPLALGLANSGQVRTPNGDAVPNTYNWAVNALGIKAASRFQLPLLDTRPSGGEMDPGGDAAGMGWLSEVSAEDYDLVDGEMYFDANQFAVLGRADTTWTTFVQPERVAGGLGDGETWTGGLQQNLVYSGSTSNFILNLETDINFVPAGSHVRVFNFLTFGAGGSPTVTVKVGGTPLSAVARNKMSEFLFYDDGGTGRWLLLHDSVTTAQLP